MGKSGLRGDASEFAVPSVELVLFFVAGKNFVLVLCVLLSGGRSKDTLVRRGGCSVLVVKTEGLSGRGIEG